MSTITEIIEEAPIELDKNGPGAAAPGPSSVVDVNNLTVTFTRSGKSVHALRDVTLNVAEKEVVALVGESGSGKSALGLALLGILPRRPAPVVGGRAEVCGVDMIHALEEVRRENRRLHLGAIFQDPMTSLNPTIRVGRQVAEAAGSTEAAVALMSAAGIPNPTERLRQYPHELSGGLRQRVMIAMAIAGDPALVIADEPTTALDVTVQAQILELIARLQRERAMSFVFITHDLAVPRRVADRIIVLYGGRIVEEGPAEDVLAMPAHPYTVGLLESRVTLHGDRHDELTTLAGEPLDPTATPIGSAYAPRCPIVEPTCNEVAPNLVATIDGDQHVASCLRLPAAAEMRLREKVAVPISLGA